MTTQPEGSPEPGQSEPPKYFGMTKRAHVITGIVFAVVFLFCIGAIGGWFGEPDPDPAPLSEQAQNVCYSEVLDQLKSPSSADLVDVAAFPEGEGWTVEGSVDAQNSFGTMIRSEFTCTLRQSGDGWIIDSIDIT